MKSEVTLLLEEIRSGDQAALARLLPIVYEELHRMAANRMRYESPGQTLQTTALVHEAYLRLVGAESGSPWDSRGHFFAAAAESMRRILVEAARRRTRLKRGGDRGRAEFDESDMVAPMKSDEVLAVDEALGRLEAENPEAARLVKLRYFAGFTNQEAAELMGFSPRKATQVWAFARAWLATAIQDENH